MIEDFHKAYTMIKSIQFDAESEEKLNEYIDFFEYLEKDYTLPNFKSTFELR